MVENLLLDTLKVQNVQLLANRLSSQESIELENVMILCDEDRDHFLKTLKNPPKANKELKEAFDYYYNKKSKDA